MIIESVSHCLDFDIVGQVVRTQARSRHIIGLAIQLIFVRLWHPKTQRMAQLISRRPIYPLRFQIDS